MMKRRAFITMIGGAAAAWPLAARAQLGGKLPTIGFLGASTASETHQRAAAFLRRLNELGWIEGRTVAVEYRWAEASRRRFEEFASEFVRLKVDIIFANSTEAILAAKRATSTIPIVFPAVGDPIGKGIVASLSRPGGNATGLSNQQTDLAGKRLQLLREFVPDLRRVACLGHIDSGNATLEMSQVREAAHTLGIEFLPLEISRAEDIAMSLDGLKGSNVNALYVIIDPLTSTNRVRINTISTQ